MPRRVAGHHLTDGGEVFPIEGVALIADLVPACAPHALETRCRGCYEKRDEHSPPCPPPQQ